jgi:hypothetical protein
VLLSGHHANVAKWRRQQALARTRARRPDLWARLLPLGKADQKLIDAYDAEQEQRQTLRQSGPESDISDSGNTNDLGRPSPLAFWEDADGTAVG